MICYLSIKSLTKQSLNFLVKTLHLIYKKSWWINYYFRVIQKNTKKYFFSLLKSHFVYKDSQEHIGYNIYKISSKILSFKTNVLLKLFKTITELVLNDIYVKFTFFIYGNKIFKSSRYLLNIKRFCLINNINKNYLKALDIFGENYILKTLRCLNSSVGRAKD